MLAQLNPKIGMGDMNRIRVAVLLLPGDLSSTWRDLPLGLTVMATTEFFVTTIVGEALAFEPDRWVFIAPPQWIEDQDPQLEAIRVQDVARALAFAADAPWPTITVDGSAVPETGEAPLNALTALTEGQLGAPVADETAFPSMLAFYYGRTISEDVAISIHLLRFSGSSTDQGRIDLTGPARVLAWGPHLALSRGRWRLRLRFRIDEQAAGSAFRIEWGSLKASSLLNAACESPGVYLAEIEHEWPDVDACEARLILTHPAFVGEFVLEGMWIGRV